MRLAITSLLLLALIPILINTHRSRGADEATPATQPYDWKSLDGIVGVKGVLKDDVYTFILPRNDLDVAVDSMEIPAGAGIASEFHFFRCSCGKMRVIGQFCCTDYESNDVIDAIRPGAMIDVANVGPMFINDKPRVTIVRFQGEGDPTTLAKLLKSALGWMGDARSATQPTK
jgi:hypothetical protein